MARKRSTPGDIDSLRNALRPRMLITRGTGTPTTIAPHTHHASEIIAEPETVTALLAGDDVQEDLEELGVEKLARSGEQAWVGPDPLDMNHYDITNVLNEEIEEDLTFSGSVGVAIIDQPRVVHMAGDHADDEAKIDGLERVVFNDEPTASSIEQPSRVEWNVGVEAGVSYTAAEGQMSWDSLEDTVVVYVASGAGLVAMVFGWGEWIMHNWAPPV